MIDIQMFKVTTTYDHEGANPRMVEAPTPEEAAKSVAAQLRATDFPHAEGGCGNGHKITIVVVPDFASPDDRYWDLWSGVYEAKWTSDGRVELPDDE